MFTDQYQEFLETITVIEVQLHVREFLKGKIADLNEDILEMYEEMLKNNRDAIASAKTFNPRFRNLFIFLEKLNKNKDLLDGLPEEDKELAFDVN